jgi:hypothetical protein
VSRSAPEAASMRTASTSFPMWRETYQTTRKRALL